MVLHRSLILPCLLALALSAAFFASVSPAARAGGPPLFDPAEYLDGSTLAVTVLDGWHVDSVNGTTRQKLIEINVAEWWPGQDYRIPVRLIVPLTGKATGFHITGAHTIEELTGDAQLWSLDSQLIAGGVGVVQTVVQKVDTLPGGAQMAEEAGARFLQTHNPRYTSMWIWAMTLMRASTAAYAETGYFNPGKIAGSGGSKNGISPAIALINDQRFSATYSSVAPAYASPLRLSEQTAIDAVTAADAWFFAALDAGEIDPGEHTRAWYKDKTWSPPTAAFDAGWTWEDIRQLAADTADEIYVSENWDQLMARGADVLFDPGTHDFFGYNILWGAQNHPEVPVYYKPNGGHEQTPHPAAEANVQNKQALIIKHFFGSSPMLQPPSSSYELAGSQLRISVTFDSGPQAEGGRLWWMYDRYPGGSAPYLWERIPDDQWVDMTFDAQTGAWTATISLESGHTTVDFFSNHGLMVDGRQTYLSSPYTRADITPVGGIAEMPHVGAAPLAASRSPAASAAPAAIAVAISALLALALGAAARLAPKRGARR